MKYSFDPKKHCHQLDGKPLMGASTICGILNKPLTWWAAELSAVECLEAGEKISTIREEYTAAVESANKSAEMKKLQAKYPIFKKARYAHNVKKAVAADEGTDYHALVEQFIKTQIAGTPFTPDPIIQSFVEWAGTNVSKFLFSELHCYSEELWVGGIADGGFYDKVGDFCILDVKRGGPYFSQFVQCGGYDILLSENGGFDAEGNQIIPPTPPAKHHVVFPSKGTHLNLPFTATHRDSFRAAVELYRNNKAYEEGGVK
jgi:hypothetical protein